MAMHVLKRVAMLFVAVALLLRFSLVLGNLECEDLTTEECAFAVSSSGARCVLEKSTLPNGEIMPHCQTSLIMAAKSQEWIESDECIRGCGLERETYGLSTDALMESGFADKLCSAECQSHCPNVIDLYLKLAAGEGVYLPRLCTESRSRARRLIADPVQVAQFGTEGTRGDNVWSSTRDEQERPKPWDSSLVFGSKAPAPQSSPIYGPSPPASPDSSKLESSRKAGLIPANPPAPTPSSAPGPYKYSALNNNDFDHEEY